MNPQYVERMWLPTKGRLDRKVRRRRLTTTLYGLASLLGFVYLVFEADVAPPIEAAAA
jgi:hypothetical protein